MQIVRLVYTDPDAGHILIGPFDTYDDAEHFTLDVFPDAPAGVDDIFVDHEGLDYTYDQLFSMRSPMYYLYQLGMSRYGNAIAHERTATLHRGGVAPACSPARMLVSRARYFNDDQWRRGAHLPVLRTPVRPPWLDRDKPRRTSR